MSAIDANNEYIRANRPAYVQLFTEATPPTDTPHITENSIPVSSGIAYNDISATEKDFAQQTCSRTLHFTIPCSQLLFSSGQGTVYCIGLYSGNAIMKNEQDRYSQKNFCAEYAFIDGDTKGIEVSSTRGDYNIFIE